MKKGRKHSDKTKKKISAAMRKRKLGNHVVKGGKYGGAIGAGVGGLSNGAYGAALGGVLGGPVGAAAGGLGGGALGALSGGFGGATSGAAYGAGTYVTRKNLDRLRGSKKYSYDFSWGQTLTLEFKRGKDKKKRKRRKKKSTANRDRAIITTAAIGSASALAGKATHKYISDKAFDKIEPLRKGLVKKGTLISKTANDARKKGALLTAVLADRKGYRTFKNVGTLDKLMSKADKKAAIIGGGVALGTAGVLTSATAYASRRKKKKRKR